MPDADPREVDLGHAVSLPPAGALDYLRRKGYAVSWDWTDLWEHAHHRAFTVAKMARFDLLQQVRVITDRALATGMTVRQAASLLEPRLRAAGWWGRKVVVDEDGQAEVVQLGSPHRLRTILRTNIATAYAAGRYQRQRELADERPYWQYVAVLDPRTRDRHRELHGLTLRADDPAWNTIYPPNGFNCRCRVRALTARQVQDRKIRVVEQTTTTPLTHEVRTDRRTGEVITRPGARVSWGKGASRRTFTPDAGWSHRPDSPLRRPGGGGRRPGAREPDGRRLRASGRRRPAGRAAAGQPGGGARRPAARRRPAHRAHPHRPCPQRAPVRAHAGRARQRAPPTGQ